MHALLDAMAAPEESRDPDQRELEYQLALAHGEDLRNQLNAERVSRANERVGFLGQIEAQEVKITHLERQIAEMRHKLQQVARDHNQ